jgi:hypothetical protein
MDYFKKLIFFTLIVIGISAQAQFIDDEEPEYAQDSVPSLRDKLFFGGNFGLMFGTFTYVNLSPTVGYRIKPNLSAGVGILYEYWQDNTTGRSFSTQIYGGKVFTQAILIDFLILYGEANMISLEKKYFDFQHNYPESGRFTLVEPWLGGGFYSKMGNGGVYFMMLFNLNHSSNSPYAPYEYRIGFNF